ncbi:MAG: hypothetical protein L3J52_09700 [Proteobacteria bacterium]|nr:hypothetical protein [Pseudomonadota bacterium]
MDQEYLTGGQLESKNRMFRKTGAFSVDDDAVPDFKAFSKRQIETITELTEPSWKKIRTASHAIKN